ncbi:hypothetical protein D9M71_406260 [compost metagenome]
MFEDGALDVVFGQQLADVHLAGVDGDGDLVGLGIEFGEHVAGVVVQPLRCFPFAFRGKRDRAADLQHHLWHGLAQQAKHFVELAQALGAFAGFFADMHMQHRGASVVAVDGFLDLLIHAHRDIVGIGGGPLRTVGSHLNHQFFLVFREQTVVKKMHVLLRPDLSLLKETSARCGSGVRRKLPVTAARLLSSWHCFLSFRHFAHLASLGDSVQVQI